MSYIKCLLCGTECYKRPCEIGKRNFCSRKCATSYRKIHPEEYPKPKTGGFRIESYRHGMFGTRTYNCWAGMKSRCRNPKSKEWRHYGGRGISYDPRWDDFMEFYKDMGKMPEGMSLDRIDVDGDYCKENCRWATWKEQENNRRINRFIEYRGEKHTCGEWASILGMNYNTLLARLNKYNWGIERAFETPVRERNNV